MSERSSSHRGPHSGPPPSGASWPKPWMAPSNSRAATTKRSAFRLSGFILQEQSAASRFAGLVTVYHCKHNVNTDDGHNTIQTRTLPAAPPWILLAGRRWLPAGTPVPQSLRLPLLPAADARVPAGLTGVAVGRGGRAAEVSVLAGRPCACKVKRCVAVSIHHVLFWLVQSCR